MSANEKQAPPKAAFVFHKPLTKVPPANAGSKARQRGEPEYTSVYMGENQNGHQLRLLPYLLLCCKIQKLYRGCGSTAEQSAKHYPDHEKTGKRDWDVLYLYARDTVLHLLRRAKSCMPIFPLLLNIFPMGNKRLPGIKACSPVSLPLQPARSPSTVSFFPP